MTELQCRRCGRPFTPKHWKQIYCGPTCRWSKKLMRKSYGPKAASIEAAQKVLVSDHITKGLTVRELAIKYDREIWEVQRLLTDAQRTGVYEKISDVILKSLVPDALGALKLALASGDTDVALRLLEGKGILVKGAQMTLNVNNDPLAEYRKEREHNESHQ